MLLSTILSILGLGVIVYALFTLAVYALPFFVAVTVGMYVYEAEAGFIAVLAAAFLSGAATLVLGQIAFATIRSGPVRLALGALFALPAGVAGYHAIRGLSEVGGANESWTLVFGSTGALVVGAIAWARVTVLSGPDNDSRSAWATLSGGRAANDG